MFFRDQQAEQRGSRASIRQIEEEEKECMLKLEITKLEKAKAEAFLEIDKQGAEGEREIKL